MITSCDCLTFYQGESKIIRTVTFFRLCSQRLLLSHILRSYYSHNGMNVSFSIASILFLEELTQLLRCKYAPTKNRGQ